MSPPLSKDDLDAIDRMIERRVAGHASPPPSTRRLDVREIIPAAVAKKISDSQHDIEDRSAGFERVILKSMGELARDVAEIKSRGLVKVTDERGTISIKPAMLVNTEATLRTEGKADAIQVAANRADTQSLDAKRAANRATATAIISMVIVGLWQAIQYIIAHASP